MTRWRHTWSCFLLLTLAACRSAECEIHIDKHCNNVSRKQMRCYLDADNCPWIENIGSVTVECLLSGERCLFGEPRRIKAGDIVEVWLYSSLMIVRTLTVVSCLSMLVQVSRSPAHPIASSTFHAMRNTADPSTPTPPLPTERSYSCREQRTPSTRCVSWPVFVLYAHARYLPNTVSATREQAHMHGLLNM